MGFVRERLEEIRPVLRRLRLADPLLMAAAIAYNMFFALIPLTIALVSWLVVFGRDDSGVAAIEDIVFEALPAELATFMISLIETARDTVLGEQGIVIVIALLVALYSGSRAVYAVQKSLRLLQGAEEARAYVHARGLGMLFTLGAGVALVLGYVVIVSGEWLIELIEHSFGIDEVATTHHLVAIVVVISWVWVLIFAIYRWGPPRPLPRATFSAALATAAIVLSTWGVAVIVPMFGLSAVAFFGAIGLLLIWLYVIGFILVFSPAVMGAIILWMGGSAPFGVAVR